MVYANVACVVSTQSTPDVNVGFSPTPGMYDFEVFQQKHLFYTDNISNLDDHQPEVKQLCVLSKTSSIRHCIDSFLDDSGVTKWVNGFFSNPTEFKKWRKDFLNDPKYEKNTM